MRMLIGWLVMGLTAVATQYLGGQYALTGEVGWFAAQCFAAGLCIGWFTCSTMWVVGEWVKENWG